MNKKVIFVTKILISLKKITFHIFNWQKKYIKNNNMDETMNCISTNKKKQWIISFTWKKGVFEKDLVKKRSCDINKNGTIELHLNWVKQVFELKQYELPFEKGFVLETEKDQSSITYTDEGTKEFEGRNWEHIQRVMFSKN